MKSEKYSIQFDSNVNPEISETVENVHNKWPTMDELQYNWIFQRSDKRTENVMNGYRVIVTKLGEITRTYVVENSELDINLDE